LHPIAVADREECPLCLIPLPIKERDILFTPCCGIIICNGCRYKEVLNEKEKTKGNMEMNLTLIARTTSKV